MSELKAYIGPAPDEKGLADYYLKSEADKVIAHHKYKRCLAMATEDRWHDFSKEKPSEDMEGRNFIVSNGHYEKIATWCGYWENEPFMGNKLCDEVVRWKGYLTPEEEKANEATCKELKAITAYEANWKATSNGDNSVLVYLKSEADKVIAEKDEKIEELEEHIDELQKATDSAWSKVNVYYDELSHSNRMRCLTMAKWCAACRFAWSFMPDDDEVKAECKFYEKWKLRWLELAEKFKEEK